MTLAISILALFIALGCLSVVVILIFRVSAFAEEVDKLDKSTKNAIEGVRLSVEDLEKNDSVQVFEGIPGLTYDVEKKTLRVDGNIVASGDIAGSNIMKPED